MFLNRAANSVRLLYIYLVSVKMAPSIWTWCQAERLDDLLPFFSEIITTNNDACNINFFQENGNPACHYATKRGNGPEALEFQRRLAGFNAQTSPIAKIISQKYPDATKSELISITQMLILLVKQDKSEDELPPSFYKFDRITRRSKDLIIKWYSDHWNIICNYFNDVGLADSELRIISQNCNFINVE